MESSTTISKNELDGRVRDGEKKENILKKLRKELDARRKCVESLTEDAKKSEKVVNDCRAKIDTAKALISTRKVEIETDAQRVDELIVGVWDIDWKKNPKEFGDTLSVAAKAYSGESRGE